MQSQDGLRAFFGLFFETLQNHIVEFTWNVWIRLGRSERNILCVCDHDLEWVVTSEWRPSDGQEPGHRAQRVNVAAFVRRFSRCLLRRHVLRRTRNRAFRHEADVFGPGNRLRESEVEQLGDVEHISPLRRENVGWFDVAMDYVLLMDIPGIP